MGMDRIDGRWRRIDTDGAGRPPVPGRDRSPRWVTRDNINELIASHGFGGEVDLFSLDLDGVDYWIWEAMTACSPRVVILEYNSMFGADRAVTVPYDEPVRSAAASHDVLRCVA